jgi:hypothetical protein
MSFGEFPNTTLAYIPELRLDNTFFGTFNFNYNNGVVVGTVWVFHLFDNPYFDFWYGYAEFLQNNVPGGFVDVFIPAPSIQAKSMGNYNNLLSVIYKGHHGTGSLNRSWIKFMDQQIQIRVYQNVGGNNIYAAGGNPL